jgi:HEAT repeat protein
LPILAVGTDEALSAISDATLESLGEIFPDSLESSWSELDFELKRRACRCLGRVGGESAERLLADALTGSDPELRCEAALALARGACFARIPDLVRSLEAASREEAVEARDEVACLVQSLVEMARHLEASAVEAGSELIEVLVARLGDAPEPVRLATARVLAWVGRAEDADVLGLLLKDESPEVRRAAVKALPRLDFEQVEEPLRLALVDESGGVRIAAAQVLGESDRIEALEDLRPLLLDDDPNVVAVALRALGRLYKKASASSEEVHGMLRGALEADPIAAIAACEALWEFGGPLAGQLATSVLDREEPEVLRAAIACIAEHGDDADLSRLFELVSHPDWSVRAEVIQVFVDRGVRASLPTLLRRLGFEKDEFVRDQILRAARRLEE